MSTLYDDKSPEYYNSVRNEILPLLPTAPQKVLEIGCGTGATLAWLKEVKGCLETTGIELVPQAAEMARAVVDHLIVADIEDDKIFLPESSFDLIICLDVLEHLHDPWRVLRSLVCSLSAGGSVVVSLPNLRYLTVMSDLLVRGRFEYEEVGILDRTHLRFFSRKGAVKLLESSGLGDVRVVLHPDKVNGKMKLANILTFGYFRDMFSWQLLLAGRKLPIEDR